MQFLSYILDFSVVVKAIGIKDQSVFFRHREGGGWYLLGMLIRLPSQGREALVP